MFGVLKMPALEHVEEMIVEFGWTVVGTETRYNLPFSYTIGLNEKYNHPEIVIVGMNAETAHGILHAVVRCIEDGKTFVDNQESFDVIKSAHFGCDLPVRFSAVDDNYKARNLCQAWFHYDGTFEALQLLWPDEHNKFPGDTKYNHNEQFILQDKASF